MADVALKKSELRARVKAALRATTPVERAAWSAAICDRVAAMPEFAGASVVCLFAPMADEVDVWPLARRAVALGKRAVVPREWASGGGSVELGATTGLESELVASGQARGVRVPRADLEVVAVSEVELIVTPGLAFDGDRGRLGRGGGVYDALLNTVRRAGGRCVAIGAAFEVQIVAAIPTEPHDQRVDAVVTERRVLR